MIGEFGWVTTEFFMKLQRRSESLGFLKLPIAAMFTADGGRVLLKDKIGLIGLIFLESHLGTNPAVRENFQKQCMW